MLAGDVAGGSGVEFRVLGLLEVVHDGRPLRFGASQAAFVVGVVVDSRQPGRFYRSDR